MSILRQTTIDDYAFITKLKVVKEDHASASSCVLTLAVSALSFDCRVRIYKVFLVALTGADVYIAARATWKAVASVSLVRVGTCISLDLGALALKRDAVGVDEDTTTTCCLNIILLAD